MRIMIPDWNGLKPETRLDFEKRLGNMASSIWNGWDNEQRHRVLNARAVLVQAGAWEYVTSVTYGDLKRIRHWFRHHEVEYTINQRGWFLAITTSKDIGPVLKSSGWENRFNPNHFENQNNWMQPGKDVVMHLAQLIPPADRYSVIHFDRGGGKIWHWHHLKEYYTGKGGATVHDVSNAIAETNAGRHLVEFDSARSRTDIT